MPLYRCVRSYFNHVFAIYAKSSALIYFIIIYLYSVIFCCSILDGYAKFVRKKIDCTHNGHKKHIHTMNETNPIGHGEWRCRVCHTQVYQNVIDNQMCQWKRAITRMHSTMNSASSRNRGTESTILFLLINYSMCLGLFARYFAFIHLFYSDSFSHVRCAVLCVRFFFYCVCDDEC